MKLKKGVEGTIIEEDNFKVVIADNGNMKELWYSGDLEGLKKVFGKNNFERDDSNFAEKLVEDLK